MVVSTAVQVGVLVDRRGDSSPSAGATVLCPDLLFGLCPFPTFDVAAGVLPLSPFGLEEPLLAGGCGFFLQHVGTFFTLAGGGMACSLASLGGKLEALMGGACDETGVAVSTVLGDLVAEVLGWDLDRCREEFKVPLLQEDGPDGGLVAAVEPVASEEEEAKEEDVDNRNNIIMQYFQ
ncbi:hypothetical protein NDU88_000656 [Pleurodeles waltl]|uniref:Uncharacterized protein n=1 Tax=Pleurodeles waltl TaxID=8319 RepID=A0AAV7VWU0_PLEWA|nr:hypothetical protein NDU88_000656 [Pleurodeles waltl]